MLRIKIHELFIKIGSKLDGSFQTNSQKVINTAGTITKNYEKLAKNKEIEVKIKNFEKTQGQLDAIKDRNSILTDQINEQKKAMLGVEKGSIAYKNIEKNLKVLESEQKKVVESTRKLDITSDTLARQLKNEGIVTKNLTREKTLLSVKSKDLKEEIDKLSKSQNKNKETTKDQEGAITKLGSSIKGMLLAGAGILSVSAIKSYGDEAINLANEKIKAETDLQAMLKNTKYLQGDTSAIQKSTKELIDYANAIETVGVIGDETVIAGQAQLATFQLMPSTIKKLSDGMVDMLAKNKGAKATQEDATSMGNLLGKVMNGQIGALSKYGVTFSENQKKVLKFGKEQERAAMLAQILADNFGGANKALGETDEGKMVIMRAEIEGIKEEFGKGLLPVQRQFFEIFKGQGPNISKVLSSGLKVANSFFKLFTSINPTGVFDLMGRGADKAVGSIEKVIVYGTGVITTIKNNKEAMDFLKGGVLGITGAVRGTVEISKQFISWVQTGSTGVKTLGISLGVLIGLYGTYKAVSLAVLGIDKVKTLWKTTKELPATMLENMGLAQKNRALIAEKASKAGTFAIDKAKALWTYTKTLPALALENGLIAKNLVVMGAQATWNGIVAGSTGIWTGAQWLLNAALTANPIGLVVTGIGLLVGGLTLAYKKSEGFRNTINGAWTEVKGLWSSFKENPVGKFVTDIALMMNPLTNMVGLIDKVKSGWEKFKGLFGGGSPGKNGVIKKETLPNLPKFALGGYANKPSIFGEAGPEMAIPINNSQRSKGLWFETGKLLGFLGNEEKENNFSVSNKIPKEKKSLFKSEKLIEKNNTNTSTIKSDGITIEKVEFKITIQGAVENVKKATELGKEVGEKAFESFDKKLKEFQRNKGRLSFE